MCTGTSLAQGYCTREQLGHFILNLPHGKSVNETSFWSALVELPSSQTTPALSARLMSEFWDDPERNPDPPVNQYDSPWRRTIQPQIFSRQSNSTTQSHTLIYQGPIHYPVTKTGFYCVGKVVRHDREVEQD